MLPGNPNIQNIEYDGNAFILQGSANGLILFHGFTATPLEVRGLAEYIHTQSGYTVAAPLLPGHGTSPEDLSNRNYKEWLEAAEKAYADLQTTCRTIFVGGESMGGLLTLYLAARHPEIMGILLFAPALITPGLLEARILKWFIFGSPKKNLDKPQNGSIPWQGYKINPLNAVVELGKLQSYVRLLLSDVKQPAVIFQGNRDETINPFGSAAIFKSISSKNKQLIELENCGHCILLDSQRSQVYELSLQFIKHFLTVSPRVPLNENH